MEQFEVRIRYEGVATFFVSTDEGKEQAEEIGRARYANGEPEDATGSEWEEITGVSVTVVGSPAGSPDGSVPEEPRERWEEEDVDHPLADWQYAVANGDTMQGYKEWVRAEKAAKET